MEKISYHLTPEGHKKYKKEYQRIKESLKKNKAKMKEMRDELWRPEDLNPDYEPMESELISLEIRLKELEIVLKNAKIIKKQKDIVPKKITIGTTVIVESGKSIEEFTIVETLEANPTTGKISNESPVGKALIGKRAGEDIIVSSPIQKTYRIKKIT